MRVAVVQHRIRGHERMDLAALLSMSEQAADERADAIVLPCVPGLKPGVGLVEAFAANVHERAPQASLVASCIGNRRSDEVPAPVTRLGRTVVLSGDDCIDPALFHVIESLAPEALVWQMDAESSLQAEAVLELALDASLSLAGLVLIAGLTGSARGVQAFGGSAIVHLGEILAEAGEDEELLLADVPMPVTLPARHGQRPVPAPVLAQRLAVHRGVHLATSYPSDND